MDPEAENRYGSLRERRDATPGITGHAHLM